MKRLEETSALKQEIIGERIASLEKMIDAKLDRLEAIVEKSIYEYRTSISELRTEMSEIRGNVKALDARMNALETKFGWYLTLFGAGITIAVGVVQLFIK